MRNAIIAASMGLLVGWYAHTPSQVHVVRSRVNLERISTVGEVTEDVDILSTVHKKLNGRYDCTAQCFIY